MKSIKGMDTLINSNENEEEKEIEAPEPGLLAKQNNSSIGMDIDEAANNQQSIDVFANTEKPNQSEVNSVQSQNENEEPYKLCNRSSYKKKAKNLEPGSFYSQSEVATKKYSKPKHSQ
jgi:hypothetical protein